MNKKILKSGILLITFLGIASSCDEQQRTIPVTGFTNPKEAIGQMHNRELKYILQNTHAKPARGTEREYVENRLGEIHNGKKSSVSLAFLPDFPDDPELLDPEEWIAGSELSTALKKEVSKTFELFRRSACLDEIMEGIRSREVVAAGQFTGAELDLLYEHLAVARYTATFWAPEEEGGMNGMQFLEAGGLSSGNGKKSEKTVNWWKVLGVDCVGGMMGGPAGYAGASAISVIMQL